MLPSVRSLWLVCTGTLNLNSSVQKPAPLSLLALLYVLHLVCAESMDQDRGDTERSYRSHTHKFLLIFFHGIAWKKNLTYISLKQPLRCFPENWWEFSWSEIICWWYFYGFFTQLGCCGWQLLATASADLHRAVSFKPGCWLADMPALCHPNSSN